MNAGIRAVVRSAIYKGHQIYGIYEGYGGFLEDKIVPLDLSSVGDIIHRGGTILRTSRSQAWPTPEGQARALDLIEKHGIEGLVILGGDGTMRGALGLAEAGIPLVTLPCTIDNDLGYTDRSIGFNTAVHTITQAVSQIRDTTASHSRGSIIEVMGRECGDLALYAGITGGAEAIVVPEIPLDKDRIFKKVCQGRDRGKRHHIILVTEDTYPSYQLAQEMEEKTGIETTVTVLGYTQRGGSPMPEDRLMGSVLGAWAVDLLEKEGGAWALGYREGGPKRMPVKEALEVEKTFNQDLYNMLDQVSI